MFFFFARKLLTNQTVSPTLLPIRDANARNPVMAAAMLDIAMESTMPGLRLN